MVWQLEQKNLEELDHMGVAKFQEKQAFELEEWGFPVSFSSTSVQCIKSNFYLMAWLMSIVVSAAVFRKQGGGKVSNQIYFLKASLDLLDQTRTTDFQMLKSRNLRSRKVTSRHLRVPDSSSNVTSRNFRFPDIHVQNSQISRYSNLESFTLTFDKEQPPSNFWQGQLELSPTQV